MLLPIVHHPAYTADIPADHRFPMGKYRRLAERLIEDGLAPSGFVTPEPASAEQLSLAHDRAYVDAVLGLSLPRAIEREIGLPMNETVVRRACAATGGTILAARLALAHGVACNTAGGSHHARTDQGAGFCTFNDVAVAIRVLMAEGLIATALVIDCDVHQGDGTAEIFQADANVTTLSVHAEKNYPVRKRASSVDLPLEDDVGDAAYLALLRGVLPDLLDRTHPDIVFYNAGVDPHVEDRLGRLALSNEGLAARDALVLGEVRARGLAIAGVIGGGYGADVDSIARRHALLFQAASAAFA